ncbi:hypothetical protein J5N97_000644 [Dioscorea zingiberensis]|uniref:beta-galactosidase n=1 Tax=Dioscorea zingiberensis TaxID=325984 RepID=A0A9D5H157_9LILI|nr:hypothetical protein J5N97_000644 [Dioscorea zingiberensis]
MPINCLLICLCITYMQIENEYQLVEGGFHEKGPPYVIWAASMAVGLRTGVPWMMCKQDDAPDPVYHGGTNLGRSTSSYVTTSYYDEAPLDEYGLKRHPKWDHLRDLHAAVKQSSQPLLWGKHTKISLGLFQQAYIFQANSGSCAAFLVNNDTTSKVTVQFRNVAYDLPQKSISILPDCKNVVFNSATKRLLDQLTITKDTTDYLWYTVSYDYTSSDDQQLLLQVNSQAHVIHAFVNDAFIGTEHGSHDSPGVVLEKPISLLNGKNNISLLSVMVGSPDAAYLEHRIFGLQRVRIQGKMDVQDLNNQLWGYQVGLQGEQLEIYTEKGAQSVEWRTFDKFAQKPMVWYKTTFDAPPGRDAVALNLQSMGKGEIWINGESIGRYWVSFLTLQNQSSQTLRPKVQLYCHQGKRISVIDFASYGSPTGDCPNYSVGSCHSNSSKTVVEEVCLGKRRCSISVSVSRFGGDPCPGTSKSLLVAASCS